MFKTVIASTPMTTDAANICFHNINGVPFGGDNSFLATLRALAAPRMKEDENISLYFGISAYSADALASNSANESIRAIVKDYSLDNVDGQIIVHSFSADREDNLANFRLMEAGFTSCYRGYYRLDKVKAFYHKSFVVDCYINPEHKNVIVFVDNLDIKKLHYLQVSILAFLPWYFDPGAGISDIEMELLYSLRETSAEKYKSYISRIAETFDFDGARIRQMLAGFETRYEKIECEEVRKNISAIDSNIRQLNDRIGELYKNRNDACIRLLGFERKIAEGSGENSIMEYFLCNNKLYLEDLDERTMHFSVRDYLSYFDKEMAETAINNRHSFVYPYGEQTHNGITCAEMRKLMTEIFVREEPVLRIKFCAAYRFDLDGNVHAQGHHNFDDYKFAEYMPNPHIDRYRCMGGYERTINCLLGNRDYIGALEQCIASCKSLNWGDSTVMAAFMGTMWEDNGCARRCIELPDGRVVNPIEAIRWVEQQSVSVDGQKKEEDV